MSWVAVAVGGGTLAAGVAGSMMNQGQDSYQSVLPPTLGGPGSTAQEQYHRYLKQNAALGSQKLPQNTLDMGNANQTQNFQRSLDKSLRGQIGQNINFGTQGSMGQQQGLIDQILAQGRGEGPNPAMDQLRMTTDQNARSAAGMIGSQRGINPALAARMAAQNMGQVNQQAAGQGALMSAQQQIAAQQLGGGLLGQQIGQQTQQAGMNVDNQRAYSQLLAQQLGQERGLDIQQATSQGAAGLQLMGQRNQAQQNYQNMINNVYANANATNAGVSAQNAATQNQNYQGMLSGASSAAMGAAMMNQGLSNSPQAATPMITKTGNSGYMPGSNNTASWNYAQGGEVNPFKSHVAQKSLSPQTSLILGKAFLSDGGQIPGKAGVQGDSEANDTVPAMLSPGEVVIPRTAMENPEAAHAFLDKIMKKNNGPSYKNIMESKENYHNMAHGGEMHSCQYCNGGMI